MRVALSDNARKTLAAALERLIPSDEHAPGAREIRVERYITESLAGPLREQLPIYERGLLALDAEARSARGLGFAELDPDSLDGLLSRFERGDVPWPNAQEFFELLRAHAIEGFLGDPRHGGNAGKAGWTLIGFPGPRHTIPSEQQQLDAPPDR
jgi:gluconate 2-dehydrogenase gamma chain